MRPARLPPQPSEATMGTCCCDHEGYIDAGCKQHGLKSRGWSHSASQLSNMPLSLDDMMAADKKAGKDWREKRGPKEKP